MCMSMDLSKDRLLRDAKLPFMRPDKAVKAHKKTASRDMYGEQPDTNAQAMYQARVAENQSILTRNSNIRRSLLNGGKY